MQSDTGGPLLTHRFLRAFCATLLTIGFTLILAPRSAQAASADEAELFSLTNQSRAQAGLAALQDDAAAANLARAWSAYMASTGTLVHNPNLAGQVSSQVTSAWTRIGENIALGSSPSQVHGVFLGSTPHRNNILGDFNRAGVGTARDGAGRLWATVVFIKGPPIQVGPPTGSPFGALDFAAQVLGGVRVSGWAIDPDTSAPIQVHVYVDGGGTNLGNASQSRPDIGRAFPAYGSAHGFDAVLPAGPGPHQVCAYGIDAAGGGTNGLLGCRTVIVNPSPFGSLDGAVQVLGGIRVTGWTIDPDTSAPIAVHVYVDGGGTNLGQAGGSRPDVGGAFAYAGYGSGHGFDRVIPVGPGAHRVCAYGINTGAGANSLLACRTVIVNPSPFGSLDQAVATSSGIRVSGWSIDPDTSSPIEVHVYIGAGGTNLGPASQSRQDVGAVFAYAGYGPAHGYDRILPAGKGQHQVCAYGINVGPGANWLLGCRTVVVS